jgi:hypothetical protein
VRWGAAVLAASAILVSGEKAAAQVTTLRNLVFGTITSGTTTSVNKTSVSAAQWTFSGTFLVGGTFQLTLPTALSGPGTAIPITFGTSDGLRNTTNNPSSGTSFDPHTSQTVPTALFGTTVYVWLGGSVSPPLNQTPGNYSGTVVLTVTGMQ